MSDWPIFVLTLPGDDERRRPIMDALDNAGLPYDLFWGVDGRQGLPAEYAKSVDRDAALMRTGRQMTDGEFACALSHHKIYAHVINSGLPGAIILEDDAILQPGFAEFIQAREYKRVPMVLIDYAYGRALPFHRIALESGELRRAATQATAATAYSLSAKVAKQLHHASSPVSYPADWPAKLYDLGTWLMVPRLAAHNSPGQGVSHLETQRAGMTVSRVNPRRERHSLGERLRRRISVRVGREKGQR